MTKQKTYKAIKMEKGEEPIMKEENQRGGMQRKALGIDNGCRCALQWTAVNKQNKDTKGR